MQEEYKDEVQKRVKIVQNKLNEIRDSTGKQDQELSEMSMSISNVNELHRSNISKSKELSATSNKLSDMAVELSNFITRSKSQSNS
jgi:methyl-accepting chemotaxis protein